MAIYITIIQIIIVIKHADVGGEVYFRILLECLSCYVPRCGFQFISTNDVRTNCHMLLKRKTMLGIKPAVTSAPKIGRAHV